MELHDTVGEREAAPSGGGGRVFEMKPQWTERSEEELVEEAAVLYEKAVRQRLQMDNPEPPAQIDSEEELEAMSQELKLRQLCQDIAAQIMVDELEDEEK